METLVAVLLLYRRTATTGALLGVGVFANVFLLNLSYDIPVKIFSGQLLICCIFLVLSDRKRVLNFFLLNRETSPTRLYELHLKERWQRITHIVLKLGFIALFIGLPLQRSIKYHRRYESRVEVKPIKKGLYSVRSMIKNGDTLLIAAYDDLAWKDFVFDVGGQGSVNTTDTLFRQRYHRGYFQYEVDSVEQMVTFKRRSSDRASLFKMAYNLTGDDSLQLNGVVKSDSVSLLLVREDRHFQLTERQFNWVTEQIK